MITWWGMFIFCTQVAEDVEYASVASPLFVMTILLFISGIPVVEATADEKYGR